MDLVQIPITSLKRRWWNLIGGHYMDEFAEAHCKEIHGFAGIVPGAGVGELATPAAAASGADGDCFATDSLTEDYEFLLPCPRARAETGICPIACRSAGATSLPAPP